MGGAGIDVEGAGKVKDAFSLLTRKADAATKNAVRDVVTIYHRDIANNLRKKSHPKGTPTPSAPGEPPALVTGSLMRSIKDQPIRRLGQGVYEGGTGPSTVYARIQELGGVAGRAHPSTRSRLNPENQARSWRKGLNRIGPVRGFHRPHLPPRPYVRPVLTSAAGRVDARFRKLLQEVSHLG